MSGSHPRGRHVEHDPASRDYGIKRKVVAKRNVTHNVGPHLNQADLGSCEGNTSAEWLNWKKAMANRKAFWAKNGAGRKTTKLTEKQAVDLYSLGTTLDNKEIPGHYPPTDTGTTALGIAKAMVQRGAITAYNWTFDFESFLAQLQQGPVMLGLNWYDSMMEVDKHGFVAQASDDTSTNEGHAILAHAIDFSGTRIGCTNHWVNDDGTTWGVKIGDHPGSFWMKFDLAEQLLIHERGDSLIPVLL